MTEQEVANATADEIGLVTEGLQADDGADGVLIEEPCIEPAGLHDVGRVFDPRLTLARFEACVGLGRRCVVGLRQDDLPAARVSGWRCGLRGG